MAFYALQAYGLALYNVHAINNQRMWRLKDTATMVWPALAATTVMLLALITVRVLVSLSTIEMLILEVSVGAAAYTLTSLMFFPIHKIRLILFARNKKIGSKVL